MKILNISLDKKLFETGSGVEERVLEYAEIFERFDILVLCGPGHKKKEFKKVTVWPTNSRNKLFYLFDALRLSGEMIEKYGYDLVSVQEPFETGFSGWRLARKYGLKLQVQLHGDFFGSPYFKRESLLNRFRYYLGKFIVGRADGIRVVSERIKQSLLEMGIEEEKISVVPIHTEISDKRLEISNRNRDKFIFLTVGRLVPVKNIDMQFEAMAEVVKKYPGAELWIVGDGSEKGKLKLKIENRKLQNCIKLCGWHDDLAEFYQEADVFLLTSNYEGWGLAAVEAASFGLPIIMTDVGCAGEVIINGESGIVIPVGEGEKLAENMLKLISDSDFRKKLGEGARNAVLRLPNKERSLEMYKKSYKAIQT